MIEIRSLRDLLRLLFIFRRDFLWAAVATALVLVVGAFTLPTRFTSEARLIVKPGRENLSVPIDAPNRQTLVAQSTQRDPIVDEEKILTGRPVVEKALAEYLAHVGPSAPPQAFFARIKYALKSAAHEVVVAVREVPVLLGIAEPIDERARLARRMIEGMDVSHAPGSAVMEVRFTWDDPVVAQEVLSAWLHAYHEERARVLGGSSLIAFYEDKSTAATQQVDEYKSALQERLKQIDGVSASERVEAITKRLDTVRSREADAVGELAGLRRGVGVSLQRVATLPSEVVTEREIGPDTATLAVGTQLAELKRQRVEALRTYTESAPAVKAVDESIALLEARATSEARDAPRLERRTANVLTSKLQNDAVEKGVRAEELLAQVKSYRDEAATLEAERQRVLSAEPELARIERALDVAEKNSTVYLDNLEKARIDQALDESRISNIGTIEAATLNPARTFPSSVTLLLLAVPAGLLVGLLTVYLRSIVDQRIHDGSRIESRFGVKLWSTVKSVRSPADLDSAFDASIFRLVSRLPHKRIAAEGLAFALTSARSGEGCHFLGMQLQALLESEGITVLVDPEKWAPTPGQFVLLLAPGLIENRAALSKLRDADLIVLVVEARASTVPMVEHALQTLRSAFDVVDGIVVNRREFEIPRKLMRWLEA